MARTERAVLAIRLLLILLALADKALSLIPQSVRSSENRAGRYVGVTDPSSLLMGPPGSGKTMLARRLPGILPPMSEEESLEVTRVYSVAGFLLDRSGLIQTRPFRTPHHHVSMAGPVGGGSGLPRPGGVSFAHASVLCRKGPTPMEE